MRKSPLPFRGEGKGEGYAKIESQNTFSVESKTLIWTCMLPNVNLRPRKRGPHRVRRQLEAKKLLTLQRCFDLRENLLFDIFQVSGYNASRRLGMPAAAEERSYLVNIYHVPVAF